MAEKEYIEREALLQDIAETVIVSAKTGYTNPELKGINKVIGRIQAMPTADVQEVVKCENCRYRGDGDICPMFHLCWSVNEGYYWEDFTMDSKFCSYGAKMDKECEK